MMQRVFVALLTVVVFMAGYAARVWTDRGQPVPPPPAALAREYAPRPDAPAGEKKHEIDRRRQVIAEIEKFRSQINAYTAQVQEIEAEFEREFVAILTPAQAQKRAADLKRRAEQDAKRNAANRGPLTDEDIRRAQDRPLTSIYWMVTVTPRLEGLTKEYGLDATQQASVRALLSLRRQKYISLFDSTPHPSIRLSRLAPMLDRVALPETEKK